MLNNNQNLSEQEFNQMLEQVVGSLPAVVQKIIVRGDWKKSVGELVKKHELHLDQASALEGVIFNFLIGLTDIFALRKNIQTELAIPVSKVNDIMIDINDMIVEPLKQMLIDATDGDEDEAIAKAPASIASTISLAKKEEEITDRQHILNAIEEVNHAPGVGIYTPKDKTPDKPVDHKVEVKLVEPIGGSAAIVAPEAHESIAAPKPVVKQPVQMPVAAKLVEVAKPASILESKMNQVVAPKHEHIVAPVAKPAVSDPYREPVN